MAPLVYAYNSTKHGSTGYSPYNFTFGRHPQLPVDVALGLDKLGKEIKLYAAYVDDLRAQLAHAYDLASKATSKRAKNNKRSYDQYARENILVPGDRMLVRNLSARGKHKRQDLWKATPYTITRKVGDLPVYAVKPDGGGKERVLHRNLLLPSRLPEIHIAQERRRTPRVGRTPTLEGNESDGSHQGEDEVVEDLLTPSRPSKCQAPLNPEAPEFTVLEATPSTEDETTDEAPIFEMDSIHTTESPI